MKVNNNSKKDIEGRVARLEKEVSNLREIINDITLKTQVSEDTYLVFPNREALKKAFTFLISEGYPFDPLGFNCLNVPKGVGEKLREYYQKLGLKYEFEELNKEQGIKRLEERMMEVSKVPPKQAYKQIRKEYEDIEILEEED